VIILRVRFVHLALLPGRFQLKLICFVPSSWPGALLLAAAVNQGTHFTRSTKGGFDSLSQAPGFRKHFLWVPRFFGFRPV
jgi:hypothetical protein